MEKKLRVLIAENIPSDAELAQRELKTVLKNFTVKVVDTEKYFLHALETFKPDLIISDYQMPAFNGLSALKITREKSPFTPFIILTGSMNEDIAVECMKSGSDDYVLKEHIKRLGPAVSSALEKKKMELERNQAQQALRQEMDRAQKYLDVAGVMFVVLNDEGVVTLTNRKGNEILGYEPEEIIGKKWIDSFLPVSIKDQVRTIFDKLMAGEIKPVEYNENLIVTKGGEERIIAWHNAVLKDGEGNIIGTLSSGEDITERKQAEEALKSNLDQTRRLRDMVEKLSRVNTLQDAYSVAIESILAVIKADRASILLADPDGVVRFKAWEGLSPEYRTATEGHFPWELSDLKAQPITIENISEADLSEELRATVLNEGIHGCVFIPLIGKDQLLGKFMTYYNQEHTFESDEMNVARVLADNLSTVIERIQSQDALRVSEEKYRSLFEDSRDAIFVSSLDGSSFDFNQSAEELLGYSREELLSLSMENLYDKREDRLQFRQLIESQGYVKDYELKLRKKDGSVIDCLDSATVRRDRDGNIFGYQGIIRDITARKRAEEEIQRNLQEKTILLNEIHHRVKNSLQVVASLLQLQSRKITDKHILDLFSQSRNRINMMASVYEKLYRTENFASINFKEYLEDVLNNMYRSSGLSHRVSLKLTVKNVLLSLDDAIPVAIILNELFTNSIKYAFPENKKGAIEISFNLSDEETYRLLYKDNGVGLPDNVDFKTTDTLGLHLVKMLAKQINGDAVLKQNGWTTFKVEFKGYGYAQKKYSHR